MKYIHNSGNAPIYIGNKIVVQPHSYGVISNEDIELLKNSNLPVEIEGDPNFQPLWVRNNPG